MGIHSLPRRVDLDVEGSGGARLDFIVASSDMQVAQVQVLGRIPMRRDHRMVLAEVHIKGTYRMAPMGAEQCPAQTRHRNVTAEHWQQFRQEHDRWAHRYEPEPVLPVQAWSEATMGLLVRAVGPPACRIGVRVEAQEWGMLMARKRRWQARAGFEEQQHVFLDRGPQALPSACGMVRRRRGNVFAPITTVNERPEPR